MEPPLPTKGNVQLRTDRLLLRPFSKSDEAAFFAIQSDPDTQMFLHGTSDAQESYKRLLAAIKGLTTDRYGLLALTLLGSGEVIGYGGLQRCEVDSGGDLQVLVGVLPGW